jgi:hypothetical protein
MNAVEAGGRAAARCVGKGGNHDLNVGRRDLLRLPTENLVRRHRWRNWRNVRHRRLATRVRQFGEN